MIALNDLWIEAKLIFQTRWWLSSVHSDHEFPNLKAEAEGWDKAPRVSSVPRGSPCRQHYLVFQKTPAFCKGRPRDAELRGTGFSYIICNFKDLIYRQIFKHSQLTCTAIWKPHLEGDEYTQHADEVFWGKGAELTLWNWNSILGRIEVEKVCTVFCINEVTGSSCVSR